MEQSFCADLRHQDQHTEEAIMNLGINIARTKRMKPALWMVGMPLDGAAACSGGFTGPTETRDDSFVGGESPRVIVRREHND